jgi:hypothetical protein
MKSVLILEFHRRRRQRLLRSWRREPARGCVEEDLLRAYDQDTCRHLRPGYRKYREWFFGFHQQKMWFNLIQPVRINTPKWACRLLKLLKYDWSFHPSDIDIEFPSNSACRFPKWIDPRSGDWGRGSVRILMRYLQIIWSLRSGTLLPW